ncbi:MAG: class I SAM-dependent methyltransferase [Alphaproteobacteria bacterium]|nr:MAG: class I SAM-dependent methyltransferase [Alphaproteobacteria bacterium]
MRQAEIHQDYYRFSEYVSLDRFNTYWYQINEVLNLQPKNVAEIGVGTGVVKYLIEGVGVPVTTIDINEKLRPDVVSSITSAAAALNAQTFDVVLCSRVFHHIPFSDVESALENIWQLSNKYAVLVLAAEDFRIYSAFRVTAKREKFFSLPLPLFLKRIILKVTKEHSSYYHNLWKINSSRSSGKNEVNSLIGSRFSILKCYPVPTNHGHVIYVLKKK